MCSYWIGVDPTSNKNILNKQQSRTHRQGRGHVKAKAEIGVMLPQTKELPEAAGGKRGFFTRDFRLSVALPTS